MDINIKEAVEQIQYDLKPLKVNVRLLIEDHVYYVYFASDNQFVDESYWQTYWGLSFENIARIWIKKYFKKADAVPSREGTAKFQLGSLLDFLKESPNDL